MIVRHRTLVLFDGPRGAKPGHLPRQAGFLTIRLQSVYSFARNTSDDALV
jgi:hypothetical protein